MYDEELSTALAQVEACLNSQPLVSADDDGIKVLTPGHFFHRMPIVCFTGPLFLPLFCVATEALGPLSEFN